MFTTATGKLVVVIVKEVADVVCPVSAPPATPTVFTGEPPVWGLSTGPKTLRVTRTPSPGPTDTVGSGCEPCLSLPLSGDIEVVPFPLTNAGLGTFEMGMFCVSTVSVQAFAIGVGYVLRTINWHFVEPSGAHCTPTCFANSFAL